MPGPIPAGRWRVVVGKAKIVESPARYRIEVDVRTQPTLSPIPRSKYVPPRARDNGARYYAGDLHVHSRESGDASATLDENIALASQPIPEAFWRDLRSQQLVAAAAPLPCDIQR